MSVGHHGNSTRYCGGFSVLEVLAVVSMIGLLASILLPGLNSARERARQVVCASNLHQVHLANTYYAEDQGDVYCPGAANSLKNLDRWHGVRDKINERFDPSRGPLACYLNEDGRLKHCPTFPADEIAEVSGGFERGNGGYGYNNAFIGVRVRAWVSGEYTVDSDRSGAVVSNVQRPAETIMFADAAFAGKTLIEYSFAEPRFLPPWPTFRADPSIHFRHKGLANVAWCDGHVDTHRMTFSWKSGLYPSDPKRLGIGWFGTVDSNMLFDLR